MTSQQTYRIDCIASRIVEPTKRSGVPMQLLCLLDTAEESPQPSHHQASSARSRFTNPADRCQRSIWPASARAPAFVIT
jgi:hypothetical protein